MISRPALGLVCVLLTLAHGGRLLAEDTSVAAGRQLYAEQMCGLCHTRGGESGQMAHVGGVLDGISARRDADWIKRYLKDPKSMIPTSQMPPTALSDQQIADVAAFLLSGAPAASRDKSTP